MTGKDKADLIELIALKYFLRLFQGVGIYGKLLKIILFL